MIDSFSIKMPAFNQVGVDTLFFLMKFFNFFDPIIGLRGYNIHKTIIPHSQEELLRPE